jgi:TM2 domain-containing membrane protein YozV
VNEWVHCPSCQLGHSLRDDERCPRCGHPIFAAAGAPVAPAAPAATAGPAPLTAPGSGPRPPARPGQPAPHGFCAQCGSPLGAGTFCGRCGARAPEERGRSKIGAALLAFFLGSVGAHKFYLGRTLAGVLYLLFFWTFIPRVVSLVEFVLLLVMSDEPFREKYPGRASAGAVVACVVLPVVAVTAALAAIAIPNFIKYQLRSKEAAVTLELRDLVNAEARSVRAGRGFQVFEVLPAEPPGAEPRPLDVEARAVAERLGWTLGPKTHAQFRMAVIADASGNRAASFCAETDLDGDGRDAATVGFLTVADERDQVLLEPPAAPCSARAIIGEQGTRYRPEWRGKLMRVSPAEVF